MKMLAAVVVSLLACGGPAPRTATVATTESTSAALSASSGWTDSSVCYGPGQSNPPALFPPTGVPCFGHQFEFVGCARVTQHDVAPPGGVAARDNYRSTYDPSRFTELGTGETWIVAPGANNRGAEQIGADVRLNDHDRIPLVNPTSGERLTIFGKWHLVIDAAGAMTFHLVEVTCSRP